MGLRERRERCGLTLIQLEALTGIAFTRLSTLECNPAEARNMYLGTARRIADALHLYPDEDAWRGGVSAGVTGLRRIRRERHLTQRMLSALTGIPQPNISWFETGYRPVSQMYLDTARRLSEALQCDPVDFLID